MPNSPTSKPALPRTSIAFRSEYLDFDRGIHVGNLEENERITRILKLALEARFEQQFVTERWGRGVYWQWIGFLTRANRAAKPASSHVSFGCSKFFVMMDTEDRLFKCGMQVERGYLRAPKEYRHCQLQSDWDWHRLMEGMTERGSLRRELQRLVKHEGFRFQAGGWDPAPTEFSKENFPSMMTLRRQLEQGRRNRWVGFLLYYAMSDTEVKQTSGVDLIESMMAVFEETAPVMNLCMQVPLS